MRVFIVSMLRLLVVWRFISDPTILVIQVLDLIHVNWSLEIHLRVGYREANGGNGDIGRFQPPLRLQTPVISAGKEIRLDSPEVAAHSVTAAAIGPLDRPESRTAGRFALFRPRSRKRSG